MLYMTKCLVTCPVSYNNSSLIGLDKQSTSKIAVKHSESYMGQALNSDTDL